MQQRSKPQKRALRAVIFLLIVVLLYSAAANVLSVNNTWDMRHIRGFYLEPQDSLDVVMLGASELYTGFSSPLAWQQYGFTSYPLAVSSMPSCLYDSMLTETMRRQTPKVVVVEINGFLYDFNQDETDTGLHKWLDNIPMSRNKAQTIADCVPKDQQSSYFFRMEKYHDTWIEPDVWGGAAKDQLTMRRTGYSLTKSFEVIPKVETGERQVKSLELSAENEQTLRDFCERAKQLGVENVLFVRFPHRTVLSNPSVLSQLADIVREYGYGFLNCDEQMDSIGLELDGDFCDNEHMNVFGMEKFTAWFGQYLSEQYDLTAAHSDKVTAEWARCAEFVAHMLPICKQKTPGDGGNYNEFSPEFSAYR